jgi:acetoin utilization deacetylase AcuC-like enzyme
MSTYPLAAWASDHHTFALPATHPFPLGKYPRVRERLLEDGVLDAAHVHRSEPAPIEWLSLAHAPAYVARTLTGEMTRTEVQALGLPWSPALVARARAAVYGTVMAARAALGRAHAERGSGVAGNLAGGMHHAFPDRGEGWCLFNDVAVAVAVLRREGLARRPFVLDLDVHQGNGTAACFAGDHETFTYSVHARHNYPLRKERSTLDVELEDGTADDVFLSRLAESLPAALDAHAPDIVFYQAGVDALASDRIGRLGMTRAGLAERDRRVFAWLAERRVPVCVMLGGGYARPIEDSVEAHVNVWRAASAARGGRPVAHGVRDAR